MTSVPSVLSLLVPSYLHRVSKPSVILVTSAAFIATLIHQQMVLLLCFHSAIMSRNFAGAASEQ